MFCERCGKRNPDGQRFCGYCGSPLVKAAVPEYEEFEERGVYRNAGEGNAYADQSAYGNNGEANGYADQTSYGNAGAGNAYADRTSYENGGGANAYANQDSYGYNGEANGYADQTSYGNDGGASGYTGRDSYDEDGYNVFDDLADLGYTEYARNGSAQQQSAPDAGADVYEDTAYGSTGYASGSDRQPSYRDSAAGQAYGAADAYDESAGWQADSAQNGSAAPANGKNPASAKKTSAKKTTAKKPPVKKSTSKKAAKKGIGPSFFVMIGTIAALALLLFFAYRTGQKITDPGKMAEQYGTAFASGDWETAYDCLSLEGADQELQSSLTESAYAAANARDGSIRYTFVSASQDDAVSGMEALSSQAGFDVTDQIASGDCFYTIHYYDENGDACTKEILLRKTGSKKYLFFDEWKICPVGMYTTGAKLQAPAGTDVTWSGALLSKTDSSDTADTYQIPASFNGTYGLEIAKSGFLTYKAIVSYDGTADLDYAKTALMPDESTQAELIKQFAADYQALLSGELNRAHFETVEGYFTKDALDSERAGDYYRTARDNAYSTDTGYGNLEVELSNISAVFEKYDFCAYGQPGDVVMQITCTAETSYTTDNATIQTGTEEQKLTVCYRMEDGVWKIQSLQ